MNSIAKSALIAIGGMFAGTGIIGRTVWIAKEGTKEVPLSAAERVVDEPPVVQISDAIDTSMPVAEEGKAQAGTPRIPTRKDFEAYFVCPFPTTINTYDYDKDGHHNVTEAIEFYIDNASASWFPYSNNKNGEISRKEVELIIDWYRAASGKVTRIEDKEKCFDIIAELHKAIDGKESIPSPLPVLLTKYDTDGDRRISLEEAYGLYKDKTGNKLERDSEGKLTSQAQRRVVDFYDAASVRLTQRESLSAVFREVKKKAKIEYKEKFGAWYSPEDDLQFEQGFEK